MCLKEYYTLTFTNREAYERVLTRLKKHKNHSVSGIFYIIENYNSGETKESRSKYNYKSLMNLVKFGGGFYIVVKQFPFKEWSIESKYIYGLTDVIEKIGDAQDVFGKVVIEVR